MNFSLAWLSLSFHFKNEFCQNYCFFYFMNPVWIINFSQTFILDLEIVYFDYSKILN